jgi:selenoprotein W-related protein
LEHELKNEFSNIDINLISSSGGVFEIMLDENLIFSKKSLKRFPNDGEIIKLINGI